MARTLNPTLVASELPSYEFLIVSEKSWFYVPFLSPGGPLQGPYRGGPASTCTTCGVQGAWLMNFLRIPRDSEKSWYGTFLSPWGSLQGPLQGPPQQGRRVA